MHGDLPLKAKYGKQRLLLNCTCFLYCLHKKSTLQNILVYSYKPATTPSVLVGSFFVGFALFSAAKNVVCTSSTSWIILNFTFDAHSRLLCMVLFNDAKGLHLILKLENGAIKLSVQNEQMHSCPSLQSLMFPENNRNNVNFCANTIAVRLNGK